MKRREFIMLLGAAAMVRPLAARAQQPDRARGVGILMAFAESDPEGQARAASFREGLQKLGWAEGHNIRIDTRWAKPGDTESMQRFAKELVALQPDLIFSDTTPATEAVLKQTRTISIVFANVSDPVGSGLVASFPRPQLHHLISRLSEWVARLPHGVTLELALPPSIEQSGKDLSAAISSVRAEIAALHRELVNVRAAPLPASDASDCVDQFVAGLIRQGRPSVSIVGDRLRVIYRDLVTAEDLVALLCWLAPGVVCAALERELPEQHSNALPKSARLERISELEMALAERETLEEALVEAAHGAGLVDVLRRPDASPACVLGVRIAPAPAQAQVA